MVDIVFHVDGVFPFYDIIVEHMIENHFEGIKCLGDVKPKDKAEMNHLRSLGPFTRNWWRLDEFPPVYGIPDFCDVKHGFVVNRQSASKILKARAQCFKSSIEFKIRAPQDIDILVDLDDPGWIFEVLFPSLKSSRTS